MRILFGLLLFSLPFAPAGLCAQAPPLFYTVENSGADCPPPPLPSREELPVVAGLPDPFARADGSGRDTAFANWACRRAEIMMQIEHYEIGEKPGRPDSLSATYDGDSLRVRVSVGGNDLLLTAGVSLPAGDGPFPVVIGVGKGSGSLPEDLFRERKVAQIGFNFTQVMSHTQTRGAEPINVLYPDRIDMGAYSAWSWGVSRLIDGLELLAPVMKIDLDHLAITGCSFAGKMALFAGAFDERIALTIAQEPGGGGAAAWRVSETLGEVETLARTSHAWFKESMFDYAGAVEKLPFDHHELMALVAPRALLVLGNTDYEWLADEAGYVSARAAHEVWKTFGVGDRFGFSINGGHPHCQLPADQRPEVGAFLDKFLLGKTGINTAVSRHPFPDTDYGKWMEWAGGR